MGIMDIFDLKKETIKIDGTPIKVPKKPIKSGMPIVGGLDKYPVLCLIFEKRGSSYIVDFDWAGYRKDDINEYYELRKRKHTFKPPQLSQIKMTPDGKSVLILWCPARNQYIAKDIAEIEEQIVASEKNEEIRFWLVNEVKRITSKNQSWIVKNLPLITFIIVMVMTVIVVYVTYDGIANIVGELKGTTEIISEFLKAKATTGGQPVW